MAHAYAAGARGCPARCSAATRDPISRGSIRTSGR
jgi:hypothetical protein